MTAVRFFEILEEGGIPPGVANPVTGYGPEAGHPLVTHPEVGMVSFTGSRSVGRQIAVSAGEDLKHVSLEMGGKNALVVLDDADVSAAFSGATGSTRIITSKGRPQSEDADSAIRVPKMADAIVDRNGNIIIDLP